MRFLKHQFKTLISVLKEVCCVQKITLKDLVVGGLPKFVFTFACDSTAAGLWGRAFKEQRWSVHQTQQVLLGKPERCPARAKGKVKLHRTERGGLVSASLTYAGTTWTEEPY